MREKVVLLSALLPAVVVCTLRAPLAKLTAGGKRDKVELRKVQKKERKKTSCLPVTSLVFDCEIYRKL